ncbi:hypothetical protein EDC96DRAFT_249123 [Choanephora cucurbitarum]|nr:hypothetical protein EDC96DRAFT_249123 [Choanephora cucurbitarum]
MLHIWFLLALGYIRLLFSSLDSSLRFLFSYLIYLTGLLDLLLYIESLGVFSDSPFVTIGIFEHVSTIHYMMAH